MMKNFGKLRDQNKTELIGVNVITIFKYTFTVTSLIMLVCFKT